MKFKAVFLTVCLITGFSFLRCSHDDGFGCGDSISLPYFDIQDIVMTNYIYKPSGELIEIFENSQVPKNEATFIFLDYLVEYHAQNQPYFKPFSIINTAYGCSPVEDGSEGSKDEIITDFSIITLNDFDDNHLKNDTINDLFRLPYHFYNEVIVGTGDTLDVFLAQNTEPIQKEDLYLELLQTPTLNDTFQVKIIMELSTNEVYEIESMPFVFYD